MTTLIVAPDNNSLNLTQPTQSVGEPSGINQTVYDVNNLLVTTFMDNNIQIFGTWDNPHFKANNIGTLLGIKNIRDSISKLNLTDKDKGVDTIYTLGGKQEC